jgi:hypothetical protein
MSYVKTREHLEEQYGPQASARCILLQKMAATGRPYFAASAAAAAAPNRMQQNKLQDNSNRATKKIQGDKKLCHLMITVQKTCKIILNRFNHLP